VGNLTSISGYPRV